MDKVWAEKWANHSVNEQLALLELLFLLRYEISSVDTLCKSLELLQVDEILFY